MDWNNIYKEKGVIQTNIMPCIKWVGDNLVQLKNKKIKVLDAGCGTGRNLLYLQHLFNKAEINAFDISSNALELIPKEYHGTKTLADMNSGLAFPDNHFDIVISTLVVEHGTKKEIEKNVNELKRITKKGGYVVFAVPSVNDFRYRTGREIEENTFIDTPQSDGDIPHHFFDEREIDALFKGFAPLFEIEDSFQAATAKGTARSWQCVFQKK